MKKEITVGALSLGALIILIFGYNYLKRSNIFSSSTTYYAYYENVMGLYPSDPVYLNGVNKGKVGDIERLEDGRVKVELKIDGDIKINKGSVATLEGDFLGDKFVVLHLDLTSSEYHAEKETILTEVNEGMLGAVMDQLDPLSKQTMQTMVLLDTTLSRINFLLSKDKKQRASLIQTVESLNNVLAGFEVTVGSVNQLLANNASKMDNMLSNLDGLTTSVASEKESISSIINDFSKISNDLANADLEKTIASTNESLEQLNEVLTSLNNEDGNIGKLLNDTSLYSGIQKSLNSVNYLLEDFTDNPKDYVSFSVFSGKRKELRMQKKAEKQAAKNQRLDTGPVF